MATIGLALTSPESGWIRYDQANTNIGYVGTWTTTSTSSSYLGSRISSNTIGDYIKFNFTGDRIRLLSYTNSAAYSTNITISIDGINYSFSEVQNPALEQTLVFEKTGLVFAEHFVKITTTQINYTGLDSIDLNSNGILKPYTTTITVMDNFLVKQGISYYTIKSANYDSVTSHNFTALTLAGGNSPDNTDYSNFGVSNYNLLFTIMTVGSDTFIPYDKLVNNFGITMLKPN